MKHPAVDECNPFLTREGENKGGGRYFEDLHAVGNIACQTAASPPDPFESQLADALMAEFAQGIWELDRIVAALNARGCCRQDGSAWSPATFQQWLADAGARLFAVEKAGQHG